MKIQKCYICKEKFENKCFKDKKYCKVRDHCHFTGEDRSALHSYVIQNMAHLKKFL